MGDRSVDQSVDVAVDDVPLGLILCDAAGRFLQVNQPLCEIVGRTRDELLGTGYTDVLHPADRPSELACLSDLQAGKVPRYRLEVRYVRPGGELRWVVVTASRMSTEVPRPDGPDVVRRVLDLTERRRAEAERDRFFDLSHDVIAVTGFDGYVKRVNRALGRTLGWTQEELSGRPYLDLVHPDDRERTLAELAKLAGGQDAIGFESRILTKDGSYRWFRTSATPVLEEGLVYSWSTDITEERRAQAALRESEDRFRRVFEEGPMGVAIVDASLRFVGLNAALSRMLGYSEEELRERSFVDVTHPDDVDLDVRLARRTFAGEIPGYEIEKRFLRRDGEVVWGRVRAVVVRDENGEPLYGLRLVEDISEAKEAEAARRELDALKDGFLRVVSHDLQNPLVTIAGLADLLARGPQGPGEEQRSLLEKIATHAGRLQRMVATFLDVDRLYHGGIRALRRPTDLAELARQVVQGLDRRDHPLSVDVPPLAASVDPDQVEHIIENLVENACTHTPAGTPVGLRIRAEAGAVAITVDDAGPGVPADIKEAVFELFRTGAGEGRRTGIGLWVVARFAQLHGGRAWIEDRPGGGASFRVLLPDEDGGERLS